VKVLIKNKKAFHNYEVIDKYIAGISLLGPEVKSIIKGMCSLAEGFVSVREKEAFLRQVHISKWTGTHGFESDINETRERKLLLTKAELRKLHKQVQEKGLTVIPLALIYSDTKKIKLEIGVCRGKKNYDKREDLKKKQMKLEADRKVKIR